MEIYVSTDVEADGPIPGPSSMLSFGSAAYTAGKELLGTFSANLETLAGETAMQRYVAWLKALPGKPVFVGYPAGFDFLFLIITIVYFLRRDFKS